jgi:hypothetical protein
MENESNVPISEQTRQRLIKDFDKTADKWGDLRLRAVYRYHDLRIGNSEREFNLSLSLLSISVAFLAIVVPLLKDYGSILYFIDVWCFFLCSLLGLIDLFWTIYRDRYFFGTDSNWEDSIYKTAQSEAIGLREKLIQGTAVSEDVEKYLALKSRFSEDYEKRTKDRELTFWTIFLKNLHVVFIALFFIGLALLVTVTTLKISSTQSSMWNSQFTIQVK